MEILLYVASFRVKIDDGHTWLCTLPVAIIELRIMTEIRWLQYSPSSGIMEIRRKSSVVKRQRELGGAINKCLPQSNASVMA